MKFVTIILCFICLTMTATAQKPANCENCYSAIEANQHIGENIKVYGTVNHIRVDTTKWNEEMYFINIDGIYPKNNFTVLAFKNSYKNNMESIWQLMNNKIIISGLVTKDPRFKKEGVELKPSIVLITDDQVADY